MRASRAFMSLAPSSFNETVRAKRQVAGPRTPSPSRPLRGRGPPSPHGRGFLGALAAISTSPTGGRDERPAMTLGVGWGGPASVTHPVTETPTASFDPSPTPLLEA